MYFEVIGNQVGFILGTQKPTFRMYSATSLLRSEGVSVFSSVPELMLLFHLLRYVFAGQNSLKVNNLRTSLCSPSTGTELGTSYVVTKSEMNNRLYEPLSICLPVSNIFLKAKKVEQGQMNKFLLFIYIICLYFEKNVLNWILY